MSREASGTIQLSAIGKIINILSAVEDDEAEGPVGEAISAINLTTGVEADQFNRAFKKLSFSLAEDEILVVSANDFATVDAGAGLGKDNLGQALALDEAILILVVLKAGSAGALRIGGEGTGAAWNSIFDGSDTAKTIIRASSKNPGIFLLLSPSETGYAIADGSNENLQFEATGGELEFSLHIWGRENP